MRKLAFIVLFFSKALFAQDIHFTQWFNNPLFTNPALTADFDGDYRITAHQREQWASVSIPFSTTSVGFDMSLNDWGIGTQLIRDQSGSSRLSLTQFNLALARPLEEWRLGVQLGFAQRRIDYSDLVFIDDGEQINFVVKNYMDIGFGISRLMRLAQAELSTSYAIFHLNRANRSFISTTDKLAISHQFSSVLNYSLNEYWTLSPSVIFMKQQEQQQVQLGSQISFDISPFYYQSVQLEAGGYYRFGDAISLLVGMYFEQSHLAFSYDWNVSDLVPASNNLGAWELSFTHIIKSKILTKPPNKYCPVYL